MPNYFLVGAVFGCAISNSICIFIYYKYLKRKNAIINKVIFTNNRSGCCYETKELNVCLNNYCMSNNLKEILLYLDHAIDNISVCMYIFTISELCDAIIRAKIRGVSVKVVADYTMAYSSGSKLTKFSQAGIPVRFPIKSEMLVHHKFCLIDVNCNDRKLSNKISTNQILISGSMNWTMQAFSGNWDNVIISSNEELINKFNHEFKAMWKDFQPIPLQ